MKAEIIAVGTELLLGQIVNTNAQYLAQQCAAIGIDVYFQTVVGDNPDRLLEALRLASERAELVICTGGLGPTQDDLTKDVLGRFLGKSLYIHEPSMSRIREVFASRGQHMVESNTRQALMLEEAEPLLNDTGLAVGAAITSGQNHYILLPGPPKEMKPMFERYGIVWLEGLLGHRQPLYSRMLKFAGIGESTLEHELLDLIQGQQDPTIAPYAKEGEVTIRLTTRAGNGEEAALKLDPAEALIRGRLGEYMYASEEIGIETVLVQLLKRRGHTLSAAESCTGGLLSDLLTSVPGCSSVFKGSIICYSNEIKNKLLEVPRELLEGDNVPGAVSKETALKLAEGMLNSFHTEYALSITGVAGPEPSEGKPVGLVYIGLAEQGQETQVFEVKFGGSREMVKLRAAKHAFYQLWKRLKD